MHTISTISVSGADAFAFLEGQLTNDLRLLDAQATLLSAWCNPKGRVICLMTVSKISDGYALCVPAEMAEDIVKRLTLFRFRAKVDFEILPESSTVKLAEQIEAGIPWIGSGQSEKFTPHMLNLDLLDAISFDKGCYTGQEIVARTHYKGASRRRTLRFKSEKPLKAGDKVSLNGRELGNVLNSAGIDLLAVVPADEVNGDLTSNGIRLLYCPLPYLKL